MFISAFFLTTDANMWFAWLTWGIWAGWTFTFADCRCPLMLSISAGANISDRLCRSKGSPEYILLHYPGVRYLDHRLNPCSKICRIAKGANVDRLAIVHEHISFACLSFC